MNPVVIVPNNKLNYEYCSELFFFLIPLNYDISIDSDFNELFENKLKYYKNYIIIKVCDKYINILFNNEETVIQKDNPLIDKELEKLINIYIK